MKLPLVLLVLPLMGLASAPAEPVAARVFDPHTDLLSLHYDHAPDKDDGHSAAADRSMLETLHGAEWIKRHVVAVSGAYGTNAKTFNDKSDGVMDACWNDVGGWLDAHQDRNPVVAELARRWSATLEQGGHVWVKEGGQSDITVLVIESIARRNPEWKLKQRVHVVQHSDWNENKTTKAALVQVKQLAHYIRIRDANAYLNAKGGDLAFEQAALAHPKFGPMWKAAFSYYPASQRLDFSDTGELMHLLGLGEIGIDGFRKRFLESKPAAKAP